MWAVQDAALNLSPGTFEEASYRKLGWYASDKELAGVVRPAEPDLIRLNIETPLAAIAQTTAHEVKHSYQCRYYPLKPSLEPFLEAEATAYGRYAAQRPPLPLGLPL